MVNRKGVTKGLAASWFALIAGFSGAPGVFANESLHVLRYSDDGEGRLQAVGTGLYVGGDQKSGDAVEETSYPQYIVEHAPVGKARIVELRGRDPQALTREAERRGVEPLVVIEQEDALDEVTTLVDSGPAANRIDLVFMGDGYTRAERELFITDVQRMVNDMFASDTFRSYLPLFNVHVVFRPSNESGIGRGRSKDTAYGLYREGDTLRAIFPGKPGVARTSCAAAPGCDYPVIIANDPHYGGLGGEFAISTSSLTSGTVVLRHELGHNFGRVGEEYDGGGYFGQNHSSSVRNLKWNHWLTETPARAEPAAARFLAWPWHNLSRGPYRVNFRSDGTYASAAIRISASGIATSDTLRMTLDGSPFPFTPRGDDDRAFYDFVDLPSFAPGSHELVFEEGVADGNNWVSSLTIHEYGADFRHSNEHIGAYPLFREDGSVGGYRSNNEACLMRDMMSRHFCAVCQENNWIEFFGKVKLIDAVDVSRDNDTVAVSLRTQQVGQFRSGEQRDEDGRIAIRWFRDGSEVESLRDLAVWSMPAGDARGAWTVEAVYETPEVRHDPRNLLKDRREIRI